MPAYHIAVTRRVWLEIVSWMANTPTSPRPNLRVAQNALRRCNCFAEQNGLTGCLICTPSTASLVTNGMLSKATSRRPKASSSFDGLEKSAPERDDFNPGRFDRTRSRPRNDTAKERVNNYHRQTVTWASVLRAVALPPVTARGAPWRFFPKRQFIPSASRMSKMRGQCLRDPTRSRPSQSSG
jgi:hypothetical protein